MAKDDDIVFFYDADGNKVSNDPRWLAKQTLRTMEDTVDNPDDPSVEQGVDDPSDYDDWKGKALLEEVRRRRAEGREIELEGKSKRAAINALKLDDAQQAAGTDDSDSEDEESEDEEDE